MKTKILKATNEFVNMLMQIVEAESCARLLSGNERSSISSDERSAIAKRAAATRKHRAAGKKAAATRKRNARAAAAFG